jgi:formylglycine-generating enzyme required for sulfatase activity
MHRFRGTAWTEEYGLFDVAVEGVLQPEYLQEDEDGAHDGTHRHPVLHVEVEEAVDLAARVEVDLDEGVVPVEIDQLLEEQRRSDLRF